MTNAEIPEHGRMLFQSAENLRRSAPDLDAMLSSLWEILETKEFFADIADLGDEDNGGSGEWIATAYTYNAGILSKAKRAPGQRGRSKNPKQIGTISIVVRLCNSTDLEGDLPDWPWLEQACLIMGWHLGQDADDVWKIANFDPEDEALASIGHVGDGLWAWSDEQGENAHFIVLPIFALTDEDALKRFALRPVKSLFNANDPKSVARSALQDVPVLFPTSS